MTGLRTCYLSFPCYANVHPAACRAAFGGASARLRVRVLAQGHSLLAHGFNEAWCWALNAAQSGERVDYFAMLHGDIAPEPNWLDVLVAELEAGHYDVVSAVVPIKDSRGLTSTAVGHPDSADCYDVAYRLTMAEAVRLPETFTAADIPEAPGPLLVNTGCWVCRFDPKWAERCHFEIRSRIRKVGDIYQAEVNPEDWNISRQWHALGLNVAATRKVKLHHHGDAAFGNQEAWGDYDFDRDKLTAPALGPTEEVTCGDG